MVIKESVHFNTLLGRFLFTIETINFCVLESHQYQKLLTLLCLYTSCLGQMCISGMDTVA